MICKVMGIVNVTPDSFSDGGKFFRPEEAIRRARNLIADGADIIDLGGESTRPGATPIGWEEEWARIEPVLAGLVANGAPGAVTISVDTYHPATAARAIAAGAGMINCVYVEPISEMLRLLQGNDVELVMPWRPYAWEKDVRRETIDADGAGLRLEALDGRMAERIYLDPMIGFGTTREEDVELLRAVSEMAKRGRVLVGASRKRIVKKLVGEKGGVGKNVGGNVAIAVWAALNGASVVRVHDVKETVQALRVIEGLQGWRVNGLKGGMVEKSKA